MYDDIDYGALFGVEVSENEQEVAEPAEETTTETAQGENEQEVAEPAEEDKLCHKHFQHLFRADPFIFAGFERSVHHKNCPFGDM